MRLTDREIRMRAGDLGVAARTAIEQQIAVGDFFEAERFVPVTNVHMMGDMEVMGDAGFAFIESLVAAGARFTVPVTTNARCVDFERALDVRQDPTLVSRERALVAHLRALGAMQVDTCINYQTVYQPQRGEHLAWGDTGTVIWANSVAGAHTNYEAGPAAVAAGLTGVTPAYGYHLPAQRRGSLRFELRCAPADQDRKSTRLNSSHSQISYAVFCLKKKKKDIQATNCIKIMTNIIFFYCSLLLEFFFAPYT